MMIRNLLILTVMMICTTAVFAANPTVDGRYWGDGDNANYLFLRRADYNRGDVYYKIDGTTMYLLILVDGSVNDNVFGQHPADKDYVLATGWNRHIGEALIGSDHLELSVAGGGLSYDWFIDYAYDADNDSDPSESDWIADHLGPDGAGTPPPSFVCASSFVWNMNNSLWDVTLGGTRPTTSDWKSPDDTPPDNTPLNNGYNTWDPLNMWEWPMVYEMSFDISAIGPNPITVTVVTAHNSPSKDGDENIPIDPIVLTDYGDAPPPYQTLIAENGASHAIVPNGPYLGFSVDAEVDGQPNVDATGDDTLDGNDDEDGVFFDSIMCQGYNAEITVHASGYGYLNAWIDFNSNGSWADAGEQVIGVYPLNPGPNSLSIPIPAGAVAGTTFARFRFDSQGGLSYDGPANDGEVEDYQVEIVAPGIVTGHVFHDINGNAVQDPGEPNLPNLDVTITDSLGNVYTVVTDSNGDYSTTVPPGTTTMNVDESDPDMIPNPFLTTANDPQSVVAISGTTVNSPDVGYQQRNSSIGDLVFFDWDGDGVYEPGDGEIGIINVDVTLTYAGPDGILGNGDDYIWGTQTTDANGFYDFTSLPSGVFRVSVDETDILIPTTISYGTNPHDYALGLGEDYNDADFGYAPTGCLPRFDFAYDGLLNPLFAGDIIDDEWSMWGITVYTDDPASHPAMIFDSSNPTGGDADLGSPNSDFFGPGIGVGGSSGMPGENSVPRGNVLIISEDGDQLDPDDNASGGFIYFEFPFAAMVGEISLLDIEENNEVIIRAYDGSGSLIKEVMTLGLGDNSFQIAPLYAMGVRTLEFEFQGSGSIAAIDYCPVSPAIFGSLGDLVWEDLTADGIQNAGEPGIPGVLVNLRIAANDYLVAQTTTDASGNYLFGNLPDGTYYIEIDPSNFQPGGVLEGFAYSPMDAGSDDFADSDFDANSNASPDIYAPAGENDLSIDAGLFLPASIGDLVYYDYNSNGVYEPGDGETGIPGVSVSLLYAGPDGLLDTTDDVDFGTLITDVSGGYDFTNLPSGLFRVSVDETTIPVGYVLTGGTEPLEVIIDPGDDYNDADFGYGPVILIKTDAVMFEDVNTTGILDVGDTVKFEISITNPSPTKSFQADILDPLPTGLADLDYISVPPGADIYYSDATLIVVDNIVIPPASTATIVFTCVITVEAPNGETIVNTATADYDNDGIADDSDPGITGIITNTKEPVELETFCGESFYIYTEAGNGLYGHLGDGGPAVDANMWFPVQACLDQDNNLYIADYSNHVIRRVDAVTGIITTVAGIPHSRGYSGDGGQATAAQMALPSDVWVRGNFLYIAEMGNNVIRMVDLTTGIITTVAGNGTMGYSGDGGPATSAQLNRPRSVFVDVAGNIYIGDTFNFVIRKVDAATGIIDTIAGTGVAGHADDGDLAIETSLEWIHDLAMSSDGTLYFSEQNGYNLVRKIIEGRIWTVTGRAGANSIGDCGFAEDSYLSKPYAIAFDSYDNLYIADENNHKIRKIDNLTGYITTIAGTGVPGYNGDGILGYDAQLNRPTGLAVGLDNILHIVDRNNHRVRWMNLEEPARRTGFPGVAPGVIDTIAGTGIYGFTGDGSDATNVRLSYPGGLMVDNDGSVIFADRSNHRVRRINTDFSITTLVGYGSHRGYEGDGGSAFDAKLNFPNDVDKDTTGNLYISDQYNHVIRKVDTNGIITTFAGTGVAGFSGDGGPASMAQFNLPDGLAYHDNKLYVADRYNNRLRVIDLSTNIITTVAGNGSDGFGQDGVDALTTPLAMPWGIDVASSGTVYIAASGARQVRRLNLDGTIETVAGNGDYSNTGDNGYAVDASMRMPTDVAVAPDGTFFIADYRSHVIRRVDPQGFIFTYAGSGGYGYSGDKLSALDAEFNYPQSLALNPAGDLFISDRLNHVIRVVGH